MAKGISRNTYLLADDKKQAKTTRGILTGSRYTNYSREEKDLINKAVQEYKTAAQHIYISEGVGDIGIDHIKEKVMNHLELTGKAPIVLIDYLQIMAPADIRATDKQNTDKAVTELKRLSRDYNIPVIGISSFNRDNYTEPVNNASFKESGSIEYSSDVLIGLQFAGMDYRGGEKEADRKKRIRELYQAQTTRGKNGEPQELQLKILKNRNGAKGEIFLNFYPLFNYFTEPPIQGEEQTDDIENPFI
jgi:replicative DNA helicase